MGDIAWLRALDGAMVIFTGFRATGHPHRLVGKHCESGDVLIFDALLPEKTTVGDILATPVTGAYGRSMASNYNMLTRPPVVFVSGGRSRAVMRRETLDDLVRCDLD